VFAGIDLKTPRGAALAALLAWAPLSVLTYPFLRVGDPAWVTFDRVWLGALGLWVVYDLWVNRGEPRSRAGNLVVGFALLLVVTYGIRAGLTSEDRLTVLKIWVDAIVLPVVLLLAARQLLTSIDRWRMLAISLSIAGAYLGLLSIAEYVLDFELATRSGGQPFFDKELGITRVSGPFPLTEINAAALLACFGATVAWGRLRGRGWWDVTTLILVIELAGIGFTFFRAAWIGAVVIAALAVAVGVKARPRRAQIAGALAAVVVALAGLALIDVVRDRVGNSGTVAGRVATWAQDFKVFATEPLVGVGVERYSAHVTLDTFVVIDGNAAFPQPHSSYLGLLAEQGIVGFLPFLALTVAVWWLIRALRRGRAGDDELTVWACTAGVGIAFLLMSLTLTMLPYGAASAFFILMVGAAAALVDLREPRAGSTA
jgi:hypothetical protein